MQHEILYYPRIIKDLKDMLEQSVNLFGNKNAFLIKISDNNYRGVTYATFKNDVDALGTALLSLDLSGKHIALIGENRYEWCVTYLAIANGVGVIVPIDKDLSVPDLENLLTGSTVNTVVFSGRYDEKIQIAAKKVPTVQNLINMDLEQDEKGFLSFKQLLKKGKQLLASNVRTFLEVTVNPEILNFLVFTPGTTGFSKGVMLSHKNICANIMALSKIAYFGPADVALSVLPLHHNYEATCGFLLMIYSGCTVTFNEGLKYIMKNLRETRASVLFAVPLIVESLYRKIWQNIERNGQISQIKTVIIISNLHQKIFKVDLRRKFFKSILDCLGGKLRIILSGAAAVDPIASEGFRSLGVDVIQGYGLTECSPMAVINGDKWYKHDSVGLPLPGVEIKIDNPGPDGIGEVLIKGDNVMLGYYNHQFERELVFQDGWFYSGDLGYMDRQGFIYLTGRKKNVIVTGKGLNIYPEELEAQLNKSPYILESLVWGKNDESSGETFVNAKIVPNFSAIKDRLIVNEITPDDLFKVISTEIKAVNKNLPPYKTIHEFSIHEHEFVKTASKKIKRYGENLSVKLKLF